MHLVKRSSALPNSILPNSLFFTLIAAKKHIWLCDIDNCTMLLCDDIYGEEVLGRYAFIRDLVLQEMLNKLVDEKVSSLTLSSGSNRKDRLLDERSSAQYLYRIHRKVYTQEVLFSLSLILSKGCSVFHPEKEGEDKADSVSSLAVNIDDRYLFDKFQQAECKSNSPYYPLLRQHFNDQLTQDIDLSGTRAASDKLDILLIEAWLSQGLQPKVIDFFDDRFSCEHTELRETPLDSVACFLREHSHYLPIGTTIRFTKLNIISGIKYHIKQLRNNACSSTLTRDSINVAYEPDKYVVTGSQVDLTHVTAFVKRVLLPAVSAYHQYLCTPSNISLPTINT